jgi:type II secretory pathway pseudopilin PulG
MGLMPKKAVRVTMQISIVGNQRNSQGGFTYVMILVAVIVTGIFAEVATYYSSRSKQMDREAELLFRGIAYRNAIKSYYESGYPIKSYPRTLDDLVKDRRKSHKSHLRALYSDPFGNEKAGWKLLRASDGGISGVSSQNTGKPLKTGNFKPGYEKFETATSYADWTFEYVLAASAVSVQ